MKKQLVKQHGYHAMHIGDPVKKAARAFDLSQETDRRRTERRADAHAAQHEPTAGYARADQRSIGQTLAAFDRRSGRPEGSDDDRARQISLVIDGVRTAEQAAAVRKIGAKIVRVDRGREPTPYLPSDMTQAQIVQDHILDSSGSKPERRAKIAAMFDDLEARFVNPAA